VQAVGKVLERYRASKYKNKHTVPPFPADFKLHYTINGKTYEAR